MCFCEVSLELLYLILAQILDVIDADFAAQHMPQQCHVADEIEHQAVQQLVGLRNVLTLLVLADYECLHPLVPELLELLTADQFISDSIIPRSGAAVAIIQHRIPVTLHPLVYLPQLPLVVVDLNIRELQLLLQHHFEVLVDGLGFLTVVFAVELERTGHQARKAQGHELESRTIPKLQVAH